MEVPRDRKALHEVQNSILHIVECLTTSGDLPKCSLTSEWTLSDIVGGCVGRRPDHGRYPKYNELEVEGDLGVVVGPDVMKR